MRKRSPQRSEKSTPRERVAFRWLPLLPLLLLALQWAGPLASEPAELASDLPVMEDEPFVFEPSVMAELVFATPGAPVAWGSLDLTAAPEHDEIRVDLLIGRASAGRAQWTGCDSLTLVIDGVPHQAPAEYAGVPMKEGAWDALTAHVTIADIRQMYDARRVEARVCGEAFEVPPAERVRLASFVRQFDDIALTIGPSAPTPPPELGEEHEWEPPSRDTTPSPA